MSGFDDPDTIFGVDFSAARRDAGRNTWIAECTPTTDGLRVDCLSDAATVLDCTPDRDTTLNKLVTEITDGTDDRRAFGLDFPFSLPCDLLGEDPEWYKFVSETSNGDWGELGGVDTPRRLYDQAQRLTEDGGVDLLRKTDGDRDGQEPTGFRIKTQTYHGISGVLAGLADSDAVSIVPMDIPDEKTVVIEIYPAAVFRSIDGELDGPVYGTGYKRDTREAIDRRRSNVEALEAMDVNVCSHCEFAVASDDALDAVAAAYAVWQTTTSSELPDELTDDTGNIASPYDVEGYIFA